MSTTDRFIVVAYILGNRFASSPMSRSAADDAIAALNECPEVEAAYKERMDP